MNTKTVLMPTVTGPEAINQSGSAVCGVCEGIGEEDHPRSKTVPRGKQVGYIYVYLHYPDSRLLQISYKSHGCRVCAVILSCIQQESTRSPGTHGEQAQDDDDKLASFDIVQDTCEAASLVKSARMDIKSEDLQIEGCGSGRVALCIERKDRSGSPRASTELLQSHVDIHVFNGDSVAPRLQADSIELICSPVDPIDEYHLHRPAKDLLSDAHVGLVRRWMSTCEADHKKCLQNSYSGSAKRLPTRVLKIEGKSNKVMTVKLFETGDAETGVYACLSYCWGTNLQLSMATTTNLNEYRHAIPWEQLPSTISDAIKLCYKLGFEYLWVDSLCIVQDDPEDWLREASIMGGIYSRSALTLAIHLCDDASESFLQKRFWNAEQRSDGLHKYARIPFTDHRTGDKCDMFLWNYRSFAGPRFLERWWHSVQDVERNKSLGKWSSRAWTIQEWLLSPRVLHVNSMTLWDCLESHGNELEKRFLSKTIARWDFQVYFWEFIVRDFTSRQITKEKDRLPALAGLAERFQAASGGLYLAGLWLEGLPKALIWARSNCRHPMNNPMTYRAPTWSWAGLEGEVDYPRDLRVMISTSEIIGFHCQYDPPDKFTTVTEGWLDIEGPMGVVSGWTLGDGKDSWLSEVHLFTHDQHADVQTTEC